MISQGEVVFSQGGSWDLHRDRLGGSFVDIFTGVGWGKLWSSMNYVCMMLWVA